MLDWRGDALPDADTIRKLEPRRSTEGVVEFFLCKAGPRDRMPATVTRLGRLRAEVAGRKGQAVMTWRHFPTQVIKLFGQP